MTSLVPGNFFREIPGAIDAQRRGVACVSEAIEARDPERASAEFRSLLRGQGEAVVALLDSRGIFVSAPSAGAPAGS